jgi:hypothetical protein
VIKGAHLDDPRRFRIHPGIRCRTTSVGTIGLITAFKEVYLLSRCLYQACESARASNEESEKLRRDLRYELETVQAFGRLFLKNKSGINDAGLDAVGQS